MKDEILREIVQALWRWRHQGVGPRIALRSAFALREAGPEALTEGGELRGFREGGSGLDGNAGLPPSSVSASGPKEDEDG